MTKQDLLIFPFNGNGIEALDCLGDRYSCIGFVDDTPSKQGVNRWGHPVYDRSAFDSFPSALVLAVPGSSESYLSRSQLISSLGISPSRLATVIHPRATISPNARIGVNCLIYAGVMITSNAELGDHVCILPNSVIHHDVRIGEHTIIGSNTCIAGYTTVGRNCYIGGGVSIVNNIHVGDNVLVGMGSNVIRDIANNLRVAGNPALPI